MRIALSGLAPGQQVLAGDTLGRACLVLQTAAAPTCLTLAGTVEVRRLEGSCLHRKSGITACAENIDVSVRATTEEHAVSMRVDLDIVRAQHWADTDCSDDIVF